MNTVFILSTNKGTYKIKADIEQDQDSKLAVRFPYHPLMVEEIKAFQAARWHPEGKYWTIANNQRNQFQLAYLQGMNPYEKYDKELIEIEPSSRSLFNHQHEGIATVLTRKQCILAFDIGVGKSLVGIEVLERLALPKEDMIWVGPKSGLIAVQYEFWKWKYKGLSPQFHTYDSLKKFAKALNEGKVNTPRLIIFDEIQKLKNVTTQRSQAAQYVTDKMRSIYTGGGSDDNENYYIIGLSGTPAPHSPLDWYNLTEIVRPGWFREGDLRKFQNRLGLVKLEENNITGGMYPRLVTWFDDENKCKICGKYPDDFGHDPQAGDWHAYEKSRNEIQYLYQRLKGLVVVKFKKDVLSELPEINYRIIECEISESTRRMANMILKTAPRTIEAITLLRELSSGFQYTEEETEQTVTCELCKGNKTISVPELYTTCPNCDGTGQQRKIVRKVLEIPTPKDQVLKELLEEYEDVGRVVIFAAFTGCIDKIIKLVQKQGWNWIRVDGRGWDSNVTGFKSNTQEMYKIFQDYKDLYPKVAFIAHPGSGGVALTLTASPVAIFYDNDNNGEYRTQAKGRIHRPGIDLNRGATIIDIIHLETDRKVLQSLDNKESLEKISLGDLEAALTRIKAQEGVRYF